MKIAVIQICSVLDPKINIEKIQKYIEKAKEDAPDLKAVFLPEVFYSMSNGQSTTPYLVDGENEHFENIKDLAVKNSIYLLGGSAATKLDGKIVNRNFNFSPTGELLALYDKIHLFKVSLDKKNGNTNLDEANVYSAGSKLQTVDIEEFKFGLSICFDLRFPELYREYFKQGVNVISVSSAFTIPTGKAHWETLVRARAIENQSYVVACGQWGEHNEKILTYGHSMVVDPWGKVMLNCEEGEGYATCELNLNLVDEVRARMDVSPRI